MMALPTFFIIGAPKAGTTSLHYYLDQHPQIQMSAIKEPRFFAPSLNPLNEKRSINRLDKYERLFDPAVGVRGEASPNYTEYPFRQGVPERIKKLVPDAKFVYLVRDPVERTISHYDHLVASEGERGSLAKTLSDLSDPRLPYICASLYALQLELYLQQFPKQRVLVVDQADLLTDRLATLRKIFGFLAVDDAFDSSRFAVEQNKGDQHRTYSPRLASFVGRTVRPRSQWLPPRVRRALRRSAEQVLLPAHEKTTLDADSRAQLEEFYAGEVKRLRTLTGRAFPTWSV
jgi:Sulfotransferase family